MEKNLNENDLKNRTWNYKQHTSTIRWRLFGVCVCVSESTYLCVTTRLWSDNASFVVSSSLSFHMYLNLYDTCNGHIFKYKFTTLFAVYLTENHTSVQQNSGEKKDNRHIMYIVHSLLLFFDFHQIISTMEKGG